jgi:hypothetical protein
MDIHGAQVTISDMKVIDYWAPTEYQLDMIPPDKFSWTTINMGIRCACVRVGIPFTGVHRTAGNFKGDVKMPIVGIPVKAEGQFDALIPHIANSVTIQLGVYGAHMCQQILDRRFTRLLPDGQRNTMHIRCRQC